MQDNWQQTDRQIRSMLHDAEEKAPRGAWRAVSARLDSSASAAIWWKWAVPAFALAALVAGLFLSGTFDRSTAPGSDIQILAESSNITTEEPSVTEPSIPDEMPEQVDKVLRRFSRHSRLAKAEEAMETKSEEQSAGTPEPQEAVSGKSDGKAGTPAADDRKSGYDDETAAQWARIEREEHARASRAGFSGLYAQGGVGGNDSNISYGGNGVSRLAPANGSVNAGISENGASTYGVPFTLGVGARFRVADKLSLGTGIDYSLLTRSFTGSYSGSLSDRYEGTIFHSVHYIGVPVNAYYDLLSTRDGLMDVYAWGGGEAEYCISNKYHLRGASPVVIPDKAGGFQFSAALGVGIQFKLSDKLGLYLDPSVRYYFHGNQPKSVRTDKPFMFTFDAGLRFDL